ncbi:hypothetical protein HYPSUDRAFT_440763 [Hypholoma sublateritium FD-334 SS-4]|uniref:Uncharacterized protein n=1 Tax=Hypholoma sublateritium (strain FD-334 SS-4) TaxID=945553 RepID=A0A0D2P9D5_HYPSF|nr:hypothetical protein HYPSUDRAFT_440763 [Hypholoma sublateritium FD-334 SS-4]
MSWGLNGRPLRILVFLFPRRSSLNAYPSRALFSALEHAYAFIHAEYSSSGYVPDAARMHKATPCTPRFVDNPQCDVAPVRAAAPSSAVPSPSPSPPPSAALCHHPTRMDGFAYLREQPPACACTESAPSGDK